MELADLKNYLRVDADITEDDALISALAETARTYIENTTGKAYVDAGVFRQCEAMLVAHWYEHRDLSPRSGTVAEYPHAVDALLTHIKFCGAYAAKESTGGD